MILIAVMMALSALVAWGVAAWVRNRAEALRLVQVPNHRSSHVQPTANGGGLGIVVAGSIAGHTGFARGPLMADFLMTGLLYPLARFVIIPASIRVARR